MKASGTPKPRIVSVTMGQKKPEGILYFVDWKQKQTRRQSPRRLGDPELKLLRYVWLGDPETPLVNAAVQNCVWNGVSAKGTRSSEAIAAEIGIPPRETTPPPKIRPFRLKIPASSVRVFVIAMMWGKKMTVGNGRYDEHTNTHNASGPSKKRNLWNQRSIGF
jgi:hypothetical protein